MAGVFQWMIGSTWFKKYSAMIGGFCLGAWFQATYWRQIRATLGVWECDRDTYLNALLAVAGAAAITGSIVLSLEKSRREKQNGNNKGGQDV